MIVVRAFPRLHVGLVDLAGATLRRFGGAGFMINCLPVEVSVERDSTLTVGGVEKLDQSAMRDIAAALRRMQTAFSVGPIKITVRRMPPQHVGLGTKTAMVLAALKGCAVLHNIRVSPRQLQLISGRGGASGVGVNGFFRGGFIVDGGHKPDRSLEFLPSSYGEGFDVPPLLARARIPRQWRFALLLPSGRRYSGTRELRFFRSNTPILGSEVMNTMALLNHGVLPAVMEDDIDTLKLALRELHRCGFKKREIEGQPVTVRRLMKELDGQPGCAVGMSSMGPLVYAIFRREPAELIDEFRSSLGQFGRVLAVCEGRNGGHEVIV
jgi:beta-ribofuranosylaminobenzene 5'-phosphate synthase